MCPSSSFGRFAFPALPCVLSKVAHFSRAVFFGLVTGYYPFVFIMPFYACRSSVNVLWGTICRRIPASLKVIEAQEGTDTGPPVCIVRPVRIQLFFASYYFLLHVPRELSSSSYTESDARVPHQQAGERANSQVFFKTQQNL